MSDGVAILVLVLLLAGNAFFVGAEFAMVSARRDQICLLYTSPSPRDRG